MKACILGTLNKGPAEAARLVFAEFAMLAEDHLQFQYACRTLDAPLLLDRRFQDGCEADVPGIQAFVPVE